MDRVVPLHKRVLGFYGMAVALVALFAGPALADSIPFAKGEVLAAIGRGKVKRFTPTGTLIETLDDGFTSLNTTGMAFDPAGNLLLTNLQETVVSKFDNTGNLISANFLTGLSGPESIVLDAAHNIYVSEVFGGGIKKFTTSGALLGSAGSARTDWIDLAADQCTMLYTDEGSTIHRLNVCTNTPLSDFVTLSTGCFAVRIRPNGEVMAACFSAVYRLSPGGSILQTYSSFTPSQSLLFALNLDPDNTTFWTGDILTGQIYRVDIASGSQITTFNSAPASQLAGLAVVGELQVAQGGAPPVNAPTLGSRDLLFLAVLLGGLGAYLAERARVAGARSRR